MAHRYKIVDPNQPIFVEYIQSTGTQCIDLDVGEAGDVDEINIKFELTDITANQQEFAPACLYGCEFYLVKSSKVFRIFDKQGGAVSTQVVDPLKIYNAHIVRQKTRKTILTMEIGTIEMNTNQAAENNSARVSIFRWARVNGTNAYYTWMKLYSYKFTRNGEVIRDLRPCLSRESGHINEPALYDVINKRYYYNQGTGTFNVGHPIIRTYKIINTSLPVFVEYIQSTGTQYIDLNVGEAGDVDEIDIRFKLTNINANQSEFAAACLYGCEFYLVRSTNQFRIYDSGNGSTTFAASNPLKMYTAHIVRQKTGNVSLTMEMGTIQVPVTNSTENNSARVSIFRWTRPDGTYAYYAWMNLYSYKFTRNGTVIRDLRPCLSRESGHINEPALYDVINKRYYYNQGTGTFRTGQPILNTRVIMR